MGEGGDYQVAVKLLNDRFGDPCDVVDAHIWRITTWPSVEERDQKEFQRLVDALQAAVFALDKPEFEHELQSYPLCTSLHQLSATEKDDKS